MVRRPKRIRSEVVEQHVDATLRLAARCLERQQLRHLGATVILCTRLAQKGPARGIRRGWLYSTLYNRSNHRAMS